MSGQKPKFRGVDWKQELDSEQIRPDTKPLLRRARDFFEQTDGVVAAMLAVPVLAVMTIKIPFSAEALILCMWLFYRLYVHVPMDKELLKKEGIRVPRRRWDFPYRVPFMAKLLDGSYTEKKLGEGITYLGKEISTNLEIWSANTDLRTHMLVLGTTGSGKTEFLLGLVYNALVQNSGFIYTDGKGDVNLYYNIFRLARYIGREDDLLAINFLTSGRDFIDKQHDRTTNTMNPFALGSSGMLIELIIALMDDSGGSGDMWKGRAIAFVSGETRALCYLRDRGYLLLDSSTFIQYFELPVIEKLVWDKTITVDGTDIKIEDPVFEKVLKPLEAYLLTLPGYKRESKGSQEQKTVEQHGYITMQLTRLFGDMSFTYGYLFQTALGDVDMYDVVINRRILVAMLPALERAPDSLKMLGKLIVGAIKQMMAGCLGNRLEGMVREIIDSRPTNAAVPFYVVLDEYGYYAVLGFAVAPAQARSLGFPQPVDSLVRMADGSQRRMGDMQVGDVIRLPNGGTAKIEQVLDHGKLPTSTLTLESGRTVDAANVHHWPVRKVFQQHVMMTTQEIKAQIESGIVVQVGLMKDGEMLWEEVTDVAFKGVQEVRCLVVGDPLHCYLTDHDVVTHNCIVFAAQDFSSLQKASKEEADATWENTNVRVVGRVTSGQESETFRRMRGLAGDVMVQQGGAKEYRQGELTGSYVSNRDTRPERVGRIDFDDFAQQENGEFHFLVGKKSSGGRGGIRVIRGRTFYIQVKERPHWIRLNHFLKVEPPRVSGVDQELEVIDALEKAVKELMESGRLAKAFSNDPLALAGNNQPQTLLQFASYIRAAQDRHMLSLGKAVRVALVCSEIEVGIQQKARLREIEERKAASPESGEPGLAESVEAVLEAAVTAPSESAPRASAASYLDDDEPVEIAAKPKATEDSGEGAKSGDGAGGKSGGGSGGAASALVLTPVAQVEEEADGVVALSSMIANFIDGHPSISGAATGGHTDTDESTSSTTESMPPVSLLTLRPLGVDDEPNEISSYIEEKIVHADVLIGAKQDLAEVRADAQASVRQMEESTKYVEGVVPEQATLQRFSIEIEELERVAARSSIDLD